MLEKDAIYNKGRFCQKLMVWKAGEMEITNLSEMGG
jgi:hypothetical protein